MNTALQLKIKSIGDDVVLGEIIDYKLHSSFKNAVNFVSDEFHLISIVTEEVGAGPNNIVINLHNVSNISSFSVLPNGLIKINEAILNPDKVNLYNSLLEDISTLRFDYFSESFLLFKYFLLKNAPILSTAFLLDERRKNFFITPFEKNLYSSIKESVYSILDGNLESLKKLKGLGLGLTPQGDDLINGFIIAIYLYGKFFNKETREIRQKIYKFSGGSNIISDTFLRYSVSGKFYSRMKNLILSMLFNRDLIESNTLSLIKIGETSGSDIGTGFILMFEKLLQGGLKWL